MNILGGTNTRHVYVLLDKPGIMSTFANTKTLTSYSFLELEIVGKRSDEIVSLPTPPPPHPQCLGSNPEP